MKEVIVLIICIGVFYSCNDKNQEQKESLNYANNYYSQEYGTGGSIVNELKDEIYDGEYCATVSYFNPNTGTKSDYTLIIEVINNELERIDFPKGFLDNHNFDEVVFNENGLASFTEANGNNFSIQIIGEADGCLDDEPMAVQCKGITKKGTKCKNLTDNPSGFCWKHAYQAN